MAPSARIQLSSNSRWVMVALDWEDTKVNNDTQKNADMLMKGIVSSVQQTPDISPKPQKAFQVLSRTGIRGCDTAMAAGVGIQKRSFFGEVLSG